MLSESSKDANWIDGFQSKPKDVTYLTNFFRFKSFDGAEVNIYKYDVNFSLEIGYYDKLKRMGVFDKART